MSKASSLILILPAVMTASVLAQGGIAPGHRLFGPIFGTSTHLVDTNGTIVHTWPSAYPPGVAAYLSKDGSLLRSIRTGQLPEVIGGTGGGIQRLALDGSLLWDFRYDTGGVWSHHDFAELPNGNILMVAWEDKSVAEAVAAGRNPAAISGNVFRPDHIIEVQPNGASGGTIVWQWHIWDHLVQDFDPTKANFGVVADHPELIDINYASNPAIVFDWTHVNAVRYDPVHDWIVLSSPRFNEIWIVDHGTTTQEAAGHAGGPRGRGGDLLYRWGNPLAYGRGTANDQQLFFQHAPLFIPPGLPGEGNLLIFNNQVQGGSTIVEIVLPMTSGGSFPLAPGSTYGPAAPVWTYSATGFQSSFVSNAERLPNGNTLICSGNQGWIFEVNPASQVVWQYMIGAPIATQVFHAHYVERTMWADAQTISASAGGSVGFRYIGGTPRSFDVHALVGTGSGTSPGYSANGVVAPINWDAWTDFTLAAANTPMFLNTVGFLGIHGEAASSLNIQPGIIPPELVGAHFDFAYAILQWPSANLLAASNAVPVTIAP